MFRERLYETFYGDVYRALDPNGDEVRILQIHPSLSLQPGLADVLALYGSNLGGLEHEHVLHTRTIDTSEEGKARVVTDALADPVSVLEMLGGLPARNPLPLDAALALARGLLDGLASAHELDVVHGGIHPRSLFVDKSGVVKLGDFAVARAVAESAEQSEDPELGDAFRGFLAPELTFGGEADKSADVFSAGAVIFSMITGKEFRGTQPERMTAPTTVRRTIMRAMDGDPEQRFPDALELKKAFDRALVTDACALASQRDLAEHAVDALTAADLDAGFVMTDYDADPNGAKVTPQPDFARTHLDEKSATLPDAAAHGAERIPSVEVDLDEDSGSREMSDLAAILAGAGTSMPPGAPVDDEDEPGADEAPLDDGSRDEAPLDDGSRDDEPLDEAPLDEAPLDESPLDDGSRDDGPLDEAPLDEDYEDEDEEEDGYTEVEPETPRPPGPSALDSRVDEVLSALDGAASDAGEEPAGEEPAREETEEDDSQVTQVDDVFDGIDQRDPISAILALEEDDLPQQHKRIPSSQDEEATPLPPPMAEHEQPGSVTREAQDVLRGTGKSKPVVTRAAAAIDELEEEQDREEKARKELVDKADTTAPVPLPPGRRSIPASIWIAATGFALLALFVILWTQTDVFHPERAREKEEARDRKQRAEFRRRTAEQKKGGNIEIAANVDGAAVWMLLGRTPLDSMPLPVAIVHQLRFERDGYEPRDVMVLASHWTGDRAAVHVELEPGALENPMPAWPPPVPQEAQRAFVRDARLGVIHVESEPPGAQVWLLVGFTPDVRMSDFEAGVGYEFKVLKDGYRPGFVVIRPEDWRLDPGDPTVLRAAVGKNVVLERLESPGG